jgi:pSer/pThr/pTyr-binding forkhead associated (FHA) protein
MTSAQLLVVEGRPAGKSLRLPTGGYYIGRGAECQIRPDSVLVSRQHCLLRVADDGVFLRDLASRNGTLVNGRLISGEVRLNHGDRIEIGALAFEVRLDEIEAAKGAEGESALDTPAGLPAPSEGPTPAPSKKLPGEPPSA